MPEIRTSADVRAVLDDINRQSLTRDTTTALAEAVRPAGDVEPDPHRLLPADNQLAPLLPWPGLRKGATVAVTGSTSLLLLTHAAGMRDGSYAAAVGFPAFGCLAASELGVPLQRLALVPEPGPDWPTVAAALIDGVDLVAVNAPGPVPEGVLRALRARAREKGCVLLPVTAWPVADVVLEATGRRWEGLDRGRGRLRRQQLEVRSAGRGRAARPRTATVTIGEPVRQLVIPPPPPGLYDVPTTVPQPVEAAPDPWASLVHGLPRIERKRQRH